MIAPAGAGINFSAMRWPLSISRLGMLGALVLPSPLVSQATAPYVPQVPTEVVSVVTGGTWTTGRSSGVYRIVVIREGWGLAPSSGRVYVQWLAEDRRRRTTTVVATEPIREINRDFWTLGAPLLESGLDGVVLRLPGTHARTLETREFRFRLGAPKAYRQI